MATDITVVRKVVITLTPPGGLGALITELQAVAARPAIGNDSVVQSITGRDTRFELTLTKPD